MRSVGVTGTNGKTSTACLLAEALAVDGGRPPTLTTLGLSIDGQTTPVLDHRTFLAALERVHAKGERRAILEMTSLALSQGAAAAWPFTGAVFTNFTRDHLDVHATAEEYLASKAQLFLHLRPGGFAVLNADDPASALIEEVMPKHVAVHHYGRTAENAVRDVDVAWSSTTVRLDDGSELTVPLVGAHFGWNAVAAWLTAQALGVDREAAARAIARSAPVAGRFERVATSPNVVIDFAHSPDAMTKTIATARALANGARVIVVFGAAGGTDPGHRPALARAAAAADHVVITTDNPRHEDPAAIAAELASAIRDCEPAIILDRRLAIASALARAGAGDIVILAGKGHETEQLVGSERCSFSERAVVRELLGRGDRGAEGAAPRCR